MTHINRTSTKRDDNPASGATVAYQTTFGWKDIAVLVSRLIFAGLFAMAATFKFLGMGDTANFIAAAGLPVSLLLAWLGAVFEVALVVCFLSGIYFTEAALLALIYVLFLGFVFHGPSHWATNQSEFGFFVDHFTFAAGLLFAAVHGPGLRLALNYSWLSRS